MTSQDTTSDNPQVVVGLDESPQSVTALRWAATYASRTGASLHLLHVWELNSSEMYAVGAVSETLVQDARQSLTQLVIETIGSPGERVEWRLEVVEGSIGPTLVELAQRAHLLVLGTGEHSGLRRLVEPSVSHYCLSHAQCPVLAVPTLASASATLAMSTT